MTVLETMVTMAVMAILLALAVPGLSEFTQDTRRNGRVLDMVASLNRARGEAIKRGIRVTVCPSRDGRTCNGNSHWETGWIVFSDANSNAVVDADEQVIQVQAALGDDGTMRGSRSRLTYQSYGFSTGSTDTLRACDSRGAAKARSVVISNQGRVRVKTGASSCP